MSRRLFVLYSESRMCVCRGKVLFSSIAQLMFMVVKAIAANRVEDLAKYVFPSRHISGQDVTTVFSFVHRDAIAGEPVGPLWLFWLPVHLLLLAMTLCSCLSGEVSWRKQVRATQRISWSRYGVRFYTLEPCRGP